MNYYEVWVASQNYHSEKPLTYAFNKKLGTGTIVTVPLQQKIVAAIVLRSTKKPSFATKDILRTVSDSPLPSQLIDLICWLKDYYPAPFGQVVTTAIPSSLTTQSRLKSGNESNQKITQKTLPPLNEEQAEAVKTIKNNKQKSILLHGDTGTGKTRVYLEMTQDCLRKGQSVILLTPEIGLTPQLAQSSQEIFPEQTVVIHSDMTVAAKRNVWLQVLESKKPLVIIGPRSALFAPIKNVGLIVIDEFHETSYKQEQSPRYLATRAGAKLADIHKAQLILGSATPPVSDYFAFEQKQLPIIRMQHQAVKHDFGETNVKIIDLKNRQLFNRSPWISDKLIEAMNHAVQNKQQALIFLNRRGTARLVLCQDCGWQKLCPNCDLPLTYHGDSHSLHCHTCGYNEKSPLSCPKCSSNDIIFRSAGTKSIVTEIEKLLPGAKIARFDSDTHKSMGLIEQYSSLREGSADILVGTQMLGKGLDLPKLSVVGIITAETSLFFPDYTAEERTFQLVTQALGRVNRGHVAGTAIVQSQHPDSFLLKMAIEKDYHRFYKSQISERQLYKFPPFRYTLKLTCSRSSATNARKTSHQLMDKLLELKAPVEIIGPSPAFIEKSHNKYHWQLVIKSTRRHALIDIIQQLPANWTHDIDPMNLL